jgi:hypothetical protein
MRTSAERCTTGPALLRHLKGLHPTEARSALIEAGANDLLEDVFAELRIDRPVLLEITREDNPVLSFWPFTEASAVALAGLASAYSSVALLGVPTLYEVLRRGGSGNRELWLFDRDDYFYREESSTGFMQCDVRLDIPPRFNDLFDLVIGDPPWYIEDYRSWLAAAQRIVRPGGTVVFVLFPDMVRETAQIERNQVLEIANRMFVEYTIQSDAVEYETPSFEKVQMIYNGIKPVNWRKADLIIGRARSEREFACSPERVWSESAWTERRIGSGRLFVKLEGPHPRSILLETVEPEGRFLTSPSRRNPNRARANLLSSRGHGICCADPDRLLMLVDQVAQCGDIGSVLDDIDAGSKQLFKSLAIDLWPRYIELN